MQTLKYNNAKSAEKPMNEACGEKGKNLKI